MNRRDLMKGSALAIGAATACVFSERAGAADARIVVEEHWAKKGNVDLYLYRKRVPGPGSQPVLVLVHGSSFSGQIVDLPGAWTSPLLPHGRVRTVRLRRMDDGPRRL